MTDLAITAAASSRLHDPEGPAFQEFRIEMADVTIQVAYGPANGDPLLLIHGVGRAWRDAAPLLSALMPRWNIIAPDLRGHGGSSRTVGKYLIRDYLQDIKALLELIDRPVVIYGHSLGALLAALAAADCPDRVRAVIAEDPPSADFLARIDETAYGAIFRAMQRLAGTSRDVGAIARELGDIVVGQSTRGQTRFRDIRDGAAIRFSARWLCDLDPAVYTPILERQWREGVDFPEAWNRVRCPTMLLAGDELAGGMLPAAAAQDILQRLVDGTLINFPRVGHQIHWMAREATLQVLLAFLESL
jgi:pimeloyl-ACP methyl ester carboxylesterase